MEKRQIVRNKQLRDNEYLQISTQTTVITRIPLEIGGECRYISIVKISNLNDGNRRHAHDGKIPTMIRILLCHYYEKEDAIVL